MRVGLFSGGYFFTAEIAEGYAEKNKNLEVANGCEQFQILAPFRCALRSVMSSAKDYAD